jgi:(2Fe-2S) ferredoxin
MKLITTAACAAAAGVFTAATAVAMPPPAHNFVGAPMSGANEVPVVETCGEGATLVKLKDGVLSYKVNVEDLDDIVAAHLHYGRPGENGPVLVTLFEAPPPEPEPLHDDDGSGDDDYGDDDKDTLAFGSISDDDVENPGDIFFDDGTPFEGGADGLLRLLREGSIYVNVHTVNNPMGEIRAQLRGNGTGGPNPNRGNGALCDDDDDDDDCDCDGDVDCEDARRGDLNGDGVINEDDLRILLDNFTDDDDDDAKSDDDDQAPARRGRRGMIRYGG